MSLDSLVWVLEQYGPVNPSLSVAPIHFPEVRTTDGLGLEEGTTNLVTNPSFETGLTGWAGAGGAAIVQSPVRSQVGTQSLKVVFPNGAAGTQGTVYTVPAGALANNTTYTFTADVYVPAGQVPVILSAQGPAVSGSPSSPASASTAQWQRPSVTFTTTGSGSSNPALLYVLNASTSSDGQAVWVDAAQLEAKPYATSYTDGSLGAGYAWTGTAHASTSTRAGSRIDHPIAALPQRPITICGWMRVGNAQSSGYFLNLAGAGPSALILQLAGNQLAAVKVISGAIDGVAQVGIGAAVGNLLFGALTFDGTTLAIHGSKNGDAIVSSSATTSTVPADATNINPGSGGGNNPANGGLEQLLIFNRVLPLNGSAALDITSLALGSNNQPKIVDYADDPSIVYATATKSTRGTLTALTNAGTGRYRGLRQLASNLDQLVDFSTAPYAFGTGATHRISVPAGSGIGAGQILGYGDPTDGPRFQVIKTHAPGGQHDECYVQQVTP